MKRAAVVLCVLLLSSCTIGAETTPGTPVVVKSGTPGDAVRSFYEALQANDCSKAASLLTAETRFRIVSLIGGADALKVDCESRLKGRELMAFTIDTNTPRLTAPGVAVSVTLQFPGGSEEVTVWVVQECSGQWRLLDPGRQGF